MTAHQQPNQKLQPVAGLSSTNVNNKRGIIIIPQNNTANSSLKLAQGAAAANTPSQNNITLGVSVGNLNNMAPQKVLQSNKENQNNQP